MKKILNSQNFFWEGVSGGYYNNKYAQYVLFYFIYYFHKWYNNIILFIIFFMTKNMLRNVSFFIIFLFIFLLLRYNNIVLIINVIDFIDDWWPWLDPTFSVQCLI